MRRHDEHCLQPRLYRLASEGIEAPDRVPLLVHLGTGCSHCRRALCRLARELQPGELEPAPVRPTRSGAGGREAGIGARADRDPATSPDPMVQALRRALQVEAGRQESAGLLPAHVWAARNALRSPLGFPRLVLEELRHLQLFEPLGDPLTRPMDWLGDLVAAYRRIRGRIPEAARPPFAARFGEGMALTWIYLADDAFSAGRVETGERALHIARRLLDSLRGDPWREASPQHREVLAAFEETRGEWAMQDSHCDRALRCFAAADELLRGVPIPHARLPARIRQAFALCAKKDFAAAARILRQIEPAARASGSSRIWLEAVHMRALVELESGDLSQARHRLEARAGLYLEWGDSEILDQRAWMLGCLHFHSFLRDVFRNSFCPLTEPRGEIV